MPEEQLDLILLNKSTSRSRSRPGHGPMCCWRHAGASGKAAVTQVALRQRETLATLRTREGLLVLETLLWPDEIRIPDFGFLDHDIGCGRRS